MITIDKFENVFNLKYSKEEIEKLETEHKRLYKEKLSEKYVRLLTEEIDKQIIDELKNFKNNMKI